MADILQIQVIFFISIVALLGFFFFVLEDRIYELRKEMHNRINDLEKKIDELLNKK